MPAGEKIIDPEILVGWYRRGIFPMGENETDDIFLYEPDPRAIIDPLRFHIPHSLEKTIRSGRFEIRFNTAFDEVIARCAQRDETWITRVIRESYTSLHLRGMAHSVEAWFCGTLAGGLYGVALGGAFFGESMFHIRRDASKVALAALVERMIDRRMTLLDIQFMTTHLAQFHAEEMPRSEYLKRLESALQIETLFYP
jgi:leucyl/phenylalanyl-tRNA---protein transferase